MFSEYRYLIASLPQFGELKDRGERRVILHCQGTYRVPSLRDTNK